MTCSLWKSHWSGSEHFKQVATCMCLWCFINLWCLLVESSMEFLVPVHPYMTEPGTIWLSGSTKLNANHVTCKRMKPDTWWRYLTLSLLYDHDILMDLKNKIYNGVMPYSVGFVVAFVWLIRSHTWGHLPAVIPEPGREGNSQWRVALAHPSQNPRCLATLVSTGECLNYPCEKFSNLTLP